MNSNAFARDSSTSLPTALRFASPDLADVQMTETEIAQKADCALVKCQSTKLAESKTLSEDGDNQNCYDSTLTTECCDGPGCYVPWLK